MPQVDLEALVVVCRVGSSGRKIACEPLDDDSHNIVENTHKIACEPLDGDRVEYAPDSVLLSKQAEFDWFDRNAIFVRKESMKPNVRSNSTSSQRVFKTNAAIIGLPKMQKNNNFDKRRCKPTNLRLFPPKRSESIEKSRAQMKEPGSPKVSCIGRVRSKRSRRRQEKSGHVKSEEKTKSEKKKGFFANLLSLFRRDRSIVKTEGLSVNSKKIMSENSENVLKNEVVMMAPGLRGMTRFVSGRRSCEMDEGDGARLSVDSNQRM